jgi:hypothetical protein
MLAHSGSGSSQAIEAIALIKLSPFYNRVRMNFSPMIDNNFLKFFFFGNHSKTCVFWLHEY